MNKINWSEAIFFFDIDDTLIDTAGTTLLASGSIESELKNVFEEEKANQIKIRFLEIFDSLLAGYRVKNELDWENVKGGKSEFENLSNRIGKMQPRVIKNYGSMKKWSREIFIKLACDDVGVSITSQQIKRATDAYWNILSENSKIFEGVLSLFQTIKFHQRPIYFITSSDSRMTMADDGLFDYVPQVSEKFKRDRIEKLRKKGLDYAGLAIGDPEDKPSREFFEKGITLAKFDLGEYFKYENCLMFGDSFAGDLQTPKELLGFGLVVLFQQGFQNTQEVDNQQINVGNIDAVIKYLN